MADITITIPNAAIPKVRQVFPGTQAEALAQVQTYLVRSLRQKVLEETVNIARSAAMSTVEAAGSTVREELATEWPST